MKWQKNPPLENGLYWVAYKTQANKTRYVVGQVYDAMPSIRYAKLDVFGYGHEFEFLIWRRGKYYDSYKYPSETCNPNIMWFPAKVKWLPSIKKKDLPPCSI